MGQRILLVEDDASISEMVVQYLKQEGFEVVQASDGQEALRVFGEQSFDLVVLDIMLPQLDGIEVLKQIRERSVVPVLMLSAKGSEVDKALGLGFGADDYISKPFSLLELSARVRAAIRRVTAYAEPSVMRSSELRIHEIVVNLEQHTVTKRGAELRLTAKEFQILKLLCSYPKKVFTKEQIYESVWQDAYYGDENIINVHMSRLREKIEDDPSSPQYIKTLWGIGYRLGEF